MFSVVCSVDLGASNRRGIIRGMPPLPRKDMTVLFFLWYIPTNAYPSSASLRTASPLSPFLRHPRPHHHPPHPRVSPLSSTHPSFPPLKEQNKPVSPAPSNPEHYTVLALALSFHISPQNPQSKHYPLPEPLSHHLVPYALPLSRLKFPWRGSTGGEVGAGDMRGKVGGGEGEGEEGGKKYGFAQNAS